MNSRLRLCQGGGRRAGSDAGPWQLAQSVDSADLLIDLHLHCRGSWWTLVGMVETRSAFRRR